MTSGQIIGIPELVGESCLMLNDTLSTSQVSNCTHITGRAYATFGGPINGVGLLTGANTLDVAKVNNPPKSYRALKLIFFRLGLTELSL